jgi:hypothetical protein
MDHGSLSNAQISKIDKIKPFFNYTRVIRLHLVTVEKLKFNIQPESLGFDELFVSMKKKSEQPSVKQPTLLALFVWWDTMTLKLGILAGFVIGTIYFCNRKCSNNKITHLNCWS